MEKAIITVLGKDRVGIIAFVCTLLAENNVNILDITQTITGGYFNMMMIADISGIRKPFAALVDELTAKGEEIGMQIRIQQESIFEAMHRI